MSTTVDTGIEVCPFHVEVPEDKLEDLRRRVAAARLPSKELVTDRSQGVQLATIQGLARYFNKAERGGHFAAWEEPELLATEVRAAFRALR